MLRLDVCLTRREVKRGMLKSQQVPLLPYKDQKKIGDKYRKAQEYEAEIRKLHAAAQGVLSPLELEGDVAKDRLERAKPPKCSPLRISKVPLPRFFLKITIASLTPSQRVR